ncbi:chorismate lyase [Escherichia coli]|nr:chorismate lyase [Escherichia coli]MBW1556872.1 chorismate lyase [Escherichia coli]PAC21358.1 chorismate lyase [Escherichia coli]PPV55162.1 chorismate lyase [Escherichia coli]PPW27584.1 chorismate lyase [Escherichia coli]
MVLPLHAIVAFLLRIRSLNLLYISRKHFSEIQCLYVM